MAGRKQDDDETRKAEEDNARKAARSSGVEDNDPDASEGTSLGRVGPPRKRTVSDEINAQNPNDPQTVQGMAQRQEMERRQKVEKGGGASSDKQKILELYESQGAPDDQVILNIQGMQLKVGDLR